MASNPPAGQVGEQTPIKYDPANPSKARIAKRFRLWFLSGLLGLLGLLFLGIGAVLTAAASWCERRGTTYASFQADFTLPPSTLPSVLSLSRWACTCLPAHSCSSAGVSV